MNMITPRLHAVLLAVLCVLGATNTRAADTAAGAAAWVAEYPQPNGDPARSCTTCHGRDLTKPGRNASTGKPIDPLAPSVNAKRLSDPAKVEKWLTRNCRWTLGRLCTPGEKADFIAYIRTQ